MECLFRRLGATRLVRGGPSGSERIHITQGARKAAAGSPAKQAAGKQRVRRSRRTQSWCSCEATENGKRSRAPLPSEQQYANAGGRIFASHFQ